MADAKACEASGRANGDCRIKAAFAIESWKPVDKDDCSCSRLMDMAGRIDRDAARLMARVPMVWVTMYCLFSMCACRWYN